MSLLNPTPAGQLVDSYGRPYFLWDTDLTLEAFCELLHDPDLEIQAYFVAKLMRQTKPDDVFTFVSPRQILLLWPRLTRYLGNSLEFWTWLFGTWERQGHVWR